MFQHIPHILRENSRHLLKTICLLLMLLYQSQTIRLFLGFTMLFTTIRTISNSLLWLKSCLKMLKKNPCLKHVDSVGGEWQLLIYCTVLWQCMPLLWTVGQTWLRAVTTKPVPTQTWLRAITTRVCKPEAVNTVGAPDDERHTARNMLSFYCTEE